MVEQQIAIRIRGRALQKLRARLLADSPLCVMCRKQGEKGWYFMTGKGGMNRLRVHAQPFKPDDIEGLKTRLREMNPGYEFKHVPAYDG